MKARKSSGRRLKTRRSPALMVRFVGALFITLALALLAAPTSADPIRLGVSVSLLDLTVPGDGGGVELGVGDRLGRRCGASVGQEVNTGLLDDKWITAVGGRALFYGVGDSGRGLGLGAGVRQRWQSGTILRTPDNASATSAQLRVHGIVGARWSLAAGVFVEAELGAGMTRETTSVQSPYIEGITTTDWAGSGHLDLRFGYAFIGGAGSSAAGKFEHVGYWQMVATMTGWIMWQGIGLASIADGAGLRDGGAGLAIISPGLGWLGGTFIHGDVHPDSNNVAFANSAGIWTGVLINLTNLATGRRFGRHGIAGALVGSDLGLLAGALAARSLPVTRAQVFAVDAGGAIGALFGVAISAGAELGFPGPYGRAMLISTTVGLGLGAVVAAFMDTPDAETFR